VRVLRVLRTGLRPEQQDEIALARRGLDGRRLLRGNVVGRRRRLGRECCTPARGARASDQEENGRARSRHVWL